MPERIVRHVRAMRCSGQSGLHGLRQFLPVAEVLEKNFGEGAEVGGLALYEKRGSLRSVLVTTLRQTQKAEACESVEQRLRAAKRYACRLRDTFRVGRISFERGEDAMPRGRAKDATRPAAGDKLHDSIWSGLLYSRSGFAHGRQYPPSDRNVWNTRRKFYSDSALYALETNGRRRPRALIAAVGLKARDACYTAASGRTRTGRLFRLFMMRRGAGVAEQGCLLSSFTPKG